MRCRRGRAGGLGPIGRESGSYSLRSEGAGRECQERAVIAARPRPTRASEHSMPSMRLSRELPWPSAETAESREAVAALWLASDGEAPEEA